MYADKILRKYGLRIKEYHRLLAEQGGKCAICGGDQLPGRRMAVDHDHQNQRVRGLLCDYCNRGIGLFSDDPAKLMAAVAYLHR